MNRHDRRKFLIRLVQIACWVVLLSLILWPIVEDHRIDTHKTQDVEYSHAR